MTTRDKLLKHAGESITHTDRAGGTELFVKASVIASAMCDQAITPYQVAVALTGMQMALISCKQLSETTDLDWSTLVKDISYAASFARGNVDTGPRLSTAGMPTADFNLQDVAVKMADQLAGNKS
jgi:hypothetical protein